MKEATTIHFDMGKFEVGSCRHSLGPTRSSRSGGGSDAVAFARMADIGWHQRLKLQAPTKESRNLDGTNSFPSRLVGTTYRDPKKLKPIFRRLDLTR